ncbi:MAG: hypothetical protein ACRCZP_00475, partial [Phycicoccus sp.]
TQEAARMTVPPHPLAHPGVTVRLRDGDGHTELRLRFTFAGLAQIEHDFGTVAGISRRLTAGAAALAADEAAAALSAAYDAAEEKPEGSPEQAALDQAREAASLAEVRAGRHGADAKYGMFSTLGSVMHAGLLHTGMTKEQVFDRLDVGQIQQYVEAFAAALGEAFGGPGNAPRETVATSPSLGTSGGTSPFTSDTPPLTGSGA